MRCMIFSLLLASQLTMAQDLEDVIYKKDGSVLRGEIIEQDFELGRYKIQLQGGSVFVINKDDINKISKESSYNTVDALPQHPMVMASQPITNKKNLKNVFFIGTMGKSWTDIDYDGTEYGANYSGLNLAYQHNATKNFALYGALNTGKMSSYVVDGTEYDLPSGADPEKYRSFEFDALLSTNTYEGWQFYAGLGLYSEKFSSSYDSISYNGTNIIFGMGYSWENLQTQFRIAINNSSDYYEEESHALANFQVGINY